MTDLRGTEGNEKHVGGSRVGQKQNESHHVWDLELLTSLIIGKDFISYPQFIFLVSHTRLKKQTSLHGFTAHSKQNTASKFT